MRRRLLGNRGGVDTLETLISSYRMESIPVIDSKGSNNAIASAGVSVVAGKINNGILYNNGYSNLGNSSEIQLSSGSIECWFMTSGAGSSYRGLIVKSGAYDIFLRDNFLGMYSYGNGNFYLHNTPSNDGLLHYAVLTFQLGIASGSKLYLDGNLILTNTLNASNQNNSLFIGATGETLQNALNTSIDEVRIWNKILTPEEIQEYYLNPVSL